MTSIERIQTMEARKNRIDQALSALSDALEGWDQVRLDLQELSRYYGSPDWYDDLHAEEAGEIPSDMPRGVLSEDGIWTTLEQDRTLAAELAETVLKYVRAPRA